MQFFVDGRMVSAEEMARIRAAERQLTQPKIEQKEEPKNPLECPYCGKIYKAKIGFDKHVKACKKKVQK